MKKLGVSKTLKNVSIVKGGEIEMVTQIYYGESERSCQEINVRR